MSLSDQTLAFYLSLDASPWDAATKRVEADFKKFVDRLDKATTVVSKGPQVALNKMADAFDAVASKAAKAAGIVAQFDKTLSSGKAVRVPIEFVFSGSGAAGFRQAISEAFRQALGGSRMTMTPVSRRGPSPGSRPGPTAARTAACRPRSLMSWGSPRPMVQVDPYVLGHSLALAPTQVGVECRWAPLFRP